MIDLCFRTKIGVRFNVFMRRYFDDDTAPKLFWETRKATMLEF